MPPFSNKSKAKSKDGRQSRSRNTTPSSVVSVSINTLVDTENTYTSYLHIPLLSLLVPETVSYDVILEEHGGTGGIPDPKHLDALSNNLKTLSSFASKRSQSSDLGIREIATKKKCLLDKEREREIAAREAEEKEILKRAAAVEEEASKARKGAKVKRKKDRGSMKEDRPLAHGAHGVAKQDGSSLPSNCKSMFNLGCVFQLLLRQINTATPVILIYSDSLQQHRCKHVISLCPCLFLLHLHLHYEKFLITHEKILSSCKS